MGGASGSHDSGRTGLSSRIDQSNFDGLNDFGASEELRKQRNYRAFRSPAELASLQPRHIAAPTARAGKRRVSTSILPRLV